MFAHISFALSNHQKWKIQITTEKTEELSED
jgi:hypothetical protein